MGQLLVRNLDTETIAQLKARAKRHGRSLQGEAKVILIDATSFSLEEAQAALGQIGARSLAEARTVVIRHPGALHL